MMLGNVEVAEFGYNGRGSFKGIDGTEAKALLMFLHSHCTIHVLRIIGRDNVPRVLEFLVSTILLELLVNIPSLSRGIVM